LVGARWRRQLGSGAGAVAARWWQQRGSGCLVAELSGAQRDCGGSLAAWQQRQRSGGAQRDGGCSLAAAAWRRRGGGGSVLAALSAIAVAA